MLEDHHMSALELISEAEIMSTIRYLDPDAAIVSAIRYLDAELDSEGAAEEAVRMVFEICIGLLRMLMASGIFICLYLLEALTRQSRAVEKAWHENCSNQLRKRRRQR